MIPLEQAVAAFEGVRAAKLIRYWGVSNFDLRDFERLLRVEGGGAVQTDQVLYLGRGAIEGNLT
jgi:diketogulonate reductase-like aldo/keto reductase